MGLGTPVGSGTVTTSHPTSRAAHFRADIQALRALAVGLVALNHLWPARLPGGFVGVDVFFVISGFLITGNLIRQLESRGRIAFAEFYARRARRLLPAALLVAALSLLLVFTLLPVDRWAQNARELIASSFYVENLYLTVQAADYHAGASAASIAQHYWSLSVEEQFYLLWPLLLTGFLWLGSRRDATSARRRMLAGILVFGAVFFAFSVWFSVMYPKQAYFFTPTRFWEFAIGGAIALAGIRRATTPSTPRTVLALLGWAGLAASALLISPADAFPSWRAAIPTLATGLVIVAGGAGPLRGLDRLTSWAPVQWVGDISYSIYLWHWPLIVALPFAIGTVPDWRSKLAVLALTLLLAHLTYTYVEQPGIRLRATPRRTFGVVFASMCVVLGLGVTVKWEGDRRLERTAAETEAAMLSDCFGPRALAPGASCDNVDAPPYSTTLGPETTYYTTPDGCEVVTPADDESRVPAELECDHSGGDADAPLVYLVGDSHAQQWTWAVNEIASTNGWKLRMSFVGACTVADVPAHGVINVDHVEMCREVTPVMIQRVIDQRPDLVVHAGYWANNKVEDGSGRPQLDQYVDGLGITWSRWTEAGARVVAIEDTPANAGRAADCWIVHAEDPEACRIPIADALPFTPLAEAQAALDDDRVTVLDLTDYFCSDGTCPAVVGGVPVYVDADHVNRVYSLTLVPVMQPVLEDALTR